MSRFSLFLINFIAFIALLSTTATHAEPVKQKHSVGLDFVRLIDNGQYEPDSGMINFLYQGSLTSRTAWQFAAAGGDKGTVLDLGYKLYTRGYMEGTFWQVGLAYVDVHDSKIYDNDFAVTGQVGFEHSPADHLTVSIGAKLTLLIESPATGEKEPFFSPVVAVMYTF